MAVIETRGLTKVYGEDVVAVDGLDMTVEAGEIYGFLGPNGAGKSTTINMLLDFVRPTEGSASVLGHDPQAEAEAIRRKIGVLPEGATLYDRLTGREHLTWMAGAKDVDADLEAVLDRVGLDPEEADRAVGGYSKGMQQRLAFGMALLGDPELLILDEPSSGLDPTGMQELREIIGAEAERGTTVFFSSHILGEVEAVCDRIAIMNEGRLAAVGTLDDLREDLDLHESISVELERVPGDLALADVEGVVDVEVEGRTVTARVVDPAVKADVVRYLDDRARVLDVLSADTSLEQLFNTYTGNGREATADADVDADRPPVQEVEA